MCARCLDDGNNFDTCTFHYSDYFSFWRRSRWRTENAQGRGPRLTPRSVTTTLATWAKSPRCIRLRFKDVLIPHSQKFLKYISNGKISRKAASTIFQLRVGHTPLNDYLYRFKKVDSPQCPACGHPKETPEHYLLQCPSYDHERWPILNLSGGRLPQLTKLLSSPKMLVPLANYMEATERFEMEMRQGSSE